MMKIGESETNDPHSAQLPWDHQRNKNFSNNDDNRNDHDN